MISKESGELHTQSVLRRRKVESFDFGYRMMGGRPVNSAEDGYGFKNGSDLVSWVEFDDPSYLLQNGEEYLKTVGVGSELQLTALQLEEEMCESAGQGIYSIADLERKGIGLSDVNSDLLARWSTARLELAFFAGDKQALRNITGIVDPILREKGLLQ